MPPARAVVDGSKRFTRVHGRRSRADRVPAAPTIEPCLTDRAVPGPVAAATPHQALKALVCLDTRGRHQDLDGRIDAVRAATQLHVPVVMPRDAVAPSLSRLDGTAPLGATRLAGSG